MLGSIETVLSLLSRSKATTGVHLVAKFQQTNNHKPNGGPTKLTRLASINPSLLAQPFTHFSVLLTALFPALQLHKLLWGGKGLPQGILGQQPF